MNRYSETQIMEIARQGYTTGAAEFTIVPDRCALLVIDMQASFVSPGRHSSWVPEATRQIPRIRRLIGHCRQRCIPVIYTAFAPTHRRLDRPATAALMPLVNPDVEEISEHQDDGPICTELAPLPDEVVIHKPSYGAFYDTPLETILRNMGKDTVIISGTLTNYCCGTTARQAYERGFKVIFGSDINATDLPEMHEAELKVLRRGFARVMSVRAIMEALRASSK